MGHEAKQIEEGKGDIVIKLKRTSYSLLNISTCVPPWGSTGDLITSSSLATIGSKSCLAPELWSFSGITLRDWKKHRRRSGVVPVDMVAYGPECNHND